jgi:membrane-associated phospholipid phosphatase
MEQDNWLENQSSPKLPDIPITWDSRLAVWVSSGLNPAVLAVISQILAAIQLSTPSAWRWIIYSILVTTAAPIFLLTVLLRKGKISDFDVFHRQQRYFPYIFIITLNIVILVTFLIGAAPTLLVVLLLSSILQGIIMFSINLRWKISAHSAGIANFCVFMVYLFGAAALPIFLIVPLMIWSRVRLKRHTFLQTLAGASMAILVMGSFLFYIRK